jgi:hypothetical protein
MISNTYDHLDRIVSVSVNNETQYTDTCGYSDTNACGYCHSEPDACAE